MASLQEIARARRSDFRLLLQASRKLDAAQERLEREVKRIVSRKNAVPEAADAARIIGLAQQTATALSDMSALLQTISQHWAGI